MAQAIRPRLAGLTWLRFPAALYILFFHMTAGQGLLWASPWFRQFASVGYVSVSLFFILSGFVLVYTYEGRPFELGAFWRARLARLYPVYLLSLLCTAPFFFFIFLPHSSEMAGIGMPWVSRHVPLVAALVMTMTQSWVPQAALAWNIPAWAVATEVAFYLAFPFLLRPMSRIASGRNLMMLGGSCWIVSLALGIGYVTISPDHLVATADSFEPWLNVLKFNPLARLPEFVVGMACGLWFVRGVHGPTRGSALVLGGAAATLLAIVASPWIPYPIMHSGLLTPAFAALICGMALRPRWLAAFDAKWAMLLGESSYALYLFHSLIIGIFISAAARAGVPRTPTIGKTLAEITAPILFALFIYRFVEEPARRWLRGGRTETAQKAVA
jgi:peptidoglycan/LPS O-acetylase OafA/YrhL